MLSDIAQHASPGAVVVADWLGWQSFEWQDLWTQTLATDQVMSYVISYFMDAGDREKSKLEPFNLRLMNKKTIQNIATKAARQSSKKLTIKNIFDRSVFVGRHIETGDYFKRPQPIRATMNSLLEPYRRTDLKKALVDYRSREGFNEANYYFSKLAVCWNGLVQYVAALLEDTAVFPPKGPPPLQMACGNMRNLIRAVKESVLDDARANIIEPQLAYHLRGLEAKL